MVPRKYFDTMTPDMTPWSYPKSKNPDAHTDVMAVMRALPLRNETPVLKPIIDGRLLRVGFDRKNWKTMNRR